MSRYFQIVADLDDITDAMFAFVTEPTPRRNELPIVKELDDLNPEIVEVMECMVLDGTDERADVAAYVQAVFGAGGSGPVKQEH